MIFQIAVQATGFVAGLVILRVLSKEEYAVYTICNAVLGLVMILGDAGISAGVMALVAPSWSDSKLVTQGVRSGQAIQRRLLVPFAALGAILLVLLMSRAAADALTVVSVVVVFLPLLWASLGSKLLEIPLRLHQDLGRLQIAAIGLNIARIAATLCVLPFFPLAAITFAIMAVTQVATYAATRQIAAPYLDAAVTGESAAESRILDSFKRAVPSAIYFAIASQFAIFLLSATGNQSDLADFGALSRIGLLLAIIQSMSSLVLVPRYARLAPQRRLLMSRFFGLQLALWMILIPMLVLSYVWPQSLLILLGSKYAHLESELALLIAVSAISLAVTVTYGMSSARGHVLDPKRYLPGQLVVDLTLLAIVRPHDLSSALIYQLAQQASVYCVQLVSEVVFIFRRARGSANVPV